MAGIREGISNVWQKVAKSWSISMMVATMPWKCLQAAVEQILQETDNLNQEKQLREWQRLKNMELMNVCFVGTLIASAVTGSIQWNSINTAHWAVYAVWYSTLALSLVSVMAAFYQSILLSNFVINTSGNMLLLAALRSSRDRTKARWASLFALQVPIMLLSYALITYIVGLALLVMRPLWNDPWGTSSLIAICFGVFLLLSFIAFASVCHFIYIQNEEVLKVN